MAFRASLIRCVIIVALAVIASIALALAQDGGGYNDDGVTYFANRAAATR